MAETERMPNFELGLHRKPSETSYQFSLKGRTSISKVQLLVGCACACSSKLSGNFTAWPVGGAYSHYDGDISHY